MKILSASLLLLFMLSGLISFSCATGHSETAAQQQKPKNIILLIGDGMGVSQIGAAMVASGGTLQMEKMPYTGFIKTSSADNYITDSGAGGTALASGVKTYNRAIGVDADTIPVKSILQLASGNGLATGMVVTCAMTHATPAAFIAHQKHRYMYEEIAADFLTTDIDLFIGGGRSHFEVRKDSRNISEELKNKGYSVIYDTATLKNQEHLKFAAFLADDHLLPAHEGRLNMLPLSVEIAMNLLSRNEKGFFLMVEGSQIDWAGHDNNPAYMLAEMEDFDKTVGKALEFARKDGNTLVIVTSDHETGGLALTKGDLDEGAVELTFASDDHTGVMVPVFTYGPGAEAFSGVYENTGIFDRMKTAFGL